MPNFFHLLNLPLDYAIDLKQLSEHYRTLQRQVHPDGFVQADAKIQQQAVENSAQANEAYKILKDPLLRALHLINCLGETVVLDGKNLSPEFLMQQMEWREQIEDWSSLSRVQQEALFQDLARTCENYQSQVAQAFLKKPLPTIMMAQALNEWQFFRKLLKELPEDF